MKNTSLNTYLSDADKQDIVAEYYSISIDQAKKKSADQTIKAIASFMVDLERDELEEIAERVIVDHTRSNTMDSRWVNSTYNTWSQLNNLERDRNMKYWTKVIQDIISNNFSNLHISEKKKLSEYGDKSMLLDRLPLEMSRHLEYDPRLKHTPLMYQRVEGGSLASWYETVMWKVKDNQEILNMLDWLISSLDGIDVSKFDDASESKSADLIFKSMWIIHHFSPQSQQEFDRFNLYKEKMHTTFVKVSNLMKENWDDSFSVSINSIIEILQTVSSQTLT